MKDSTAGGDQRQDVPALMRERYDLEPEPQPTTQDVIEAVADVLGRAVELATPARTAARCLTLHARLRAAAAGHLTAAELLHSLNRLTQDWS